MRLIYKSCIVLIIFVIATGCCKEKTQPIPLVDSDGDPCVGTIIQPPPEILAEVDAKKVKGLLNDASGAKGKGKLCTGKVFIVKKPITVYRVWGKTFEGQWWSFSYPEGPQDAYRKANNICKEWNSLDKLTVCYLKENSLIVIGPGQSADCKQNGPPYLNYPKSPVNQVYVPVMDLVGNCTNQVKWPAK
ncbi:MAG: hypothetical protein OEV78_11245 [Spirochaetia bacterium]|nr:hypothetical protein [Spirochaetia bacterium]